MTINETRSFSDILNIICEKKRFGVEIGAYKGSRTKEISSVFDRCYTFENYIMSDCRVELERIINRYNNITLFECDFKESIDLLPNKNIDLIFIDLGFDGYDEQKLKGVEFLENITYYNKLYEKLEPGGIFILDVEKIVISEKYIKVTNGLIIKKNHITNIEHKLKKYHIERKMFGNIEANYCYE